MNLFTAQKRSRLVYVMIEGQNAEIAVEWAKCFPCQRDTAETLPSSEKLRAVFQNLAGFAAIDELPSHLLWIKSIKKEDLESTIKNYHSKHHNIIICLHERETNAGKFRRMIKITTHTRGRSNALVMGELVCCSCHEIDVETNLCAAGAYHAKRTKNYAKHVLNLTKKWIDMAKVINDDVLLWKLSDGDVAVKRIVLS